METSADQASKSALEFNAIVDGFEDNYNNKIKKEEAKQKPIKVLLNETIIDELKGLYLRAPEDEFDDYLNIVLDWFIEHPAIIKAFGKLDSEELINIINKTPYYQTAKGWERLMTKTFCHIVLASLLSSKKVKQTSRKALSSWHLWKSITKNKSIMACSIKEIETAIEKADQN